MEVKSPGLSLFGCSLLALVSLGMCLSIEIQIAKAESYLPRPAEMPDTWRIAPGSASIDGPEHQRSLLRSFVIRLGLPQYVLIPIVLLWSGWKFLSGRKLNSKGGFIYRCCFGLAVLSGSLVHYRGYFGSLGW